MTLSPHAQQLSLANAWWLFNLSHLVYYDEPDAMVPFLNGNRCFAIWLTMPL